MRNLQNLTKLVILIFNPGKNSQYSEIITQSLCINMYVMNVHFIVKNYHKKLQYCVIETCGKFRSAIFNEDDWLHTNSANQDGWSAWFLLHNLESFPLNECLEVGRVDRSQEGGVLLGQKGVHVLQLFIKQYAHS